MGRGGKIDRIGVEAVWLGEQFAKGFDDYNKRIDAANRMTEDFAKRTQRSGRTGSAAYEQFSKSVRGSMQVASKSTKDYIATAKDLETALQGVSRTAQQFGAGLRDAAAGRAIRASFDSLAKQSGVSADQLLANMKRAARGTVEELELVRIANRALLAGGRQFATELPRLFEIARAASIATGQDIGFVFDTLTRGIAKASPLLIDNAEIYIKVGKAVEDFAAKQGKSTDELTAQERQQATLNAVLSEGEAFIRKVGSATEVATDQYDQWNVRVAEATRTGKEFLEDVLGPAAPALGALGQGLDSLIPLLQTIILMQGRISFGSLITGAAGLATALAPVAAIAAAAGAGVLVYEEAVRKLDKSLPPATETISKSAGLIQWQIRAWKDGEAAANEWLRAVSGLPTLVELGNEAQQRNLDIVQEVTEEYGRGEQAYRAYLDAVNQANAELEHGEIATLLMTEAQFNYEQAIRSSTISTQGLINAIRDLNMEQAGSSDLLQIGASIRTAVAATELMVKDAVEQTTQAQQEAIEAEKRRAEIIEGMAGFREQIAKARLDVILAEMQLNRELEQREADHQRRMVEIDRKGAQRRAKLMFDFNKALADAARTRQRALEDAAREHARAVQRIERDHRDRLDDIERSYTSTVEEAAIERDAIAIFEARKRRAQEIEDADRDRGRQLEDENINFGDRQRQAEQAYRDQVEAARRAFEEQKRQLELSLAEQRRKEQEAQKERAASTSRAQAQELRKLRNYLRQIEADYRAHLLRLKALSATIPAAVPRRRIPGRGRMQEGGSGIVTGPQTFQVEPGVTEAFWFSGALGQRAPVLPTQEVAQTIGMQAAVRGAVGVGLSGFSDGLMGRIGPQMVEMVGQAVIDELEDAFLRALP
jgi:hypothetical protein